MKSRSTGSETKSEGNCRRCFAKLDDESGYCVACGYFDSAAAEGRRLATTEAAHQRNLAGRTRARLRGPFPLLEAFIRWIINRE